MRFTVSGPVEVHVDGQPVSLARRQERCLLAILLLHANRVVPADRLCALLWDDDPPEPARRLLRSHVARIRAVLARGTGATLDWKQDGYVLRTDPAAAGRGGGCRPVHHPGRTAHADPARPVPARSAHRAGVVRRYATGATTAGVADTLVHLGDSHLAAGQRSDAQEVWRQALAPFEQLQHPDGEMTRTKLRELDRHPATAT